MYKEQGVNAEDGDGAARTAHMIPNEAFILLGVVFWFGKSNNVVLHYFPSMLVVRKGSLPPKVGRRRSSTGKNVVLPMKMIGRSVFVIADER